MNNRFFGITRRSFSALTVTAMGATLAPQAANANQANPPLKMYPNLGVGHIGVRANQLQAFEFAVQFGFGGVNAHLGDLEAMSEEELDAFLARMEEAGVQWGPGGLPVDFRRDDQTFRDGMADLPRRAAVYQRAGVTRISTWILPGSNELTYLQNFKRHAERLREAASVLNDHGLRFGLEFVGPRTSMNNFRFPFAHTQIEMLELVDEIGLPNLGLLLDAWHWHTSQGTVEELRQLTNELVVDVHVNDAPLGVPLHELQDMSRELPCATGVIDLESFMTVLKEIGYDGPLSAEPFNQELNAMEDAAAVQRTKESMDELFALIGA